jgi:hypothetical protein
MPKKFKMKRNKFGGAALPPVAAAPKAAPAPASYTGLILGIFGILIFLIFCSVAGYFIYEMLNPEQGSGTGSTPSGSDSSGGGTPLAVAPPPPKTCASFAGPCAGLKRKLEISTMSNECTDGVCTKEQCCPHCMAGHNHLSCTGGTCAEASEDSCHKTDCSDDGNGWPKDGMSYCICYGDETGNTSNPSDGYGGGYACTDGGGWGDRDNNCEADPEYRTCADNMNVVMNKSDEEGEEYMCCKLQAGVS